MPGGNDNGGGLSLQTLVIASLSSLAAALFIHKFWQAGAILGAAVTPVIVAIVSELLRKPVDAVKARTTTVNPPPVVQPAEDRFGIWEQQRKRPLHLKIAIATGVIAFLIAAFFLTGAELVLGGASDSDRFRYVPGKQERREARPQRESPGRTQPEEAAPGQPQDEAPPATVTVTTPAPPAETTPPPEEEGGPPPETTPVPAPGTTTPP